MENGRESHLIARIEKWTTTRREIQESAQAAAPQETPEVRAQPVEAAAAPHRRNRKPRPKRSSSHSKRSFQDRIDTLTRRARARSRGKSRRSHALLEEFRKPGRARTVSE